LKASFSRRAILKFSIGAPFLAGLGTAIAAVTSRTVSAASKLVDVTINPDTLLHPTADRIGINVNFLDDSDLQRPGARKLRSALEELEVRYVRYPGGHEADGVTFFLDESGNTVSTPTPRLCRFGSDEWPANDLRYWSTNSPAGTWTRDVYQLQDFLDDCAAIGAEPVIVVAVDTISNPATGMNAWTPTKEQIIANAAAMVRWCNVTNRYGVRYWELGNEAWSAATGYARGYPDATSYGADCADIAIAMKEEDPTILVGLNGNSEQWFKDALVAAGPENIDFLAAHRYPFFYMSYKEYQDVTVPNIVSEANRATNAIKSLPEPDRSRIFVMMTEMGVVSGTPNDMGAAVVLAHNIGGNLVAPNVHGAMVWVTRYPPFGFGQDQFDSLNELTPAGSAQLMTTLLAPGAMVESTSTHPDVFSFASWNREMRRYAVLILNRADSAQTVKVHAVGAASAQLWQLRGDGPSDSNPTLSATAITPIAGVATVQLPAASVSTLVLGREDEFALKLQEG
jgi:hypothetical protein